MAKLIYSTVASVDGFVADETGSFDWAAPDDQVHGYVNDLERPIGTYLYGRRMYEVMRCWDVPPDDADQPQVMRDYTAIWQAADKVVYSATLPAATTARTRVEREFDPAAVRELTERADRDVSVGGPHLAAHAFRAGLVDECHLFLVPYVVGRGNRSLPDDTRLALELVDEHRFDNGTVHLHYRVRR